MAFIKINRVYLIYSVVARQLIFLNCLPFYFNWRSLNELLEIIIHRIICRSSFHSNFFSRLVYAIFEVGFFMNGIVFLIPD